MKTSLVIVWPERETKGFGATNQFLSEPGCNPKELLDALQAAYPTDAHFVPYHVVQTSGEPQRPAPCRINKPGLNNLRSQGYDIRFDQIVFDVDCPTKEANGEASAQWRIDEGTRYHNLPEQLARSLGTYVTKGGVRYLATLTKQLTAEEYEQRHRHLASLLNQFGILVDPGTKDWSRCYRLPRVMRAGILQDRPMNLAPLAVPLDLDKLPTIRSRPQKSDAHPIRDGRQPIAKGERHNALMRLGFDLRKSKHLDRRMLSERLAAINTDPAQCEAPIPDRELAGIVEFICNADPWDERYAKRLLHDLEAESPLARFPNGDIKLTPANLETLLSKFPPLAGLLCFDDFRGTTLLTRELPASPNRSVNGFPRELEDHDVAALGVFLERLGGRRAPGSKQLGEIVDLVARQQRRNTLQDALAALPPHDGVLRIDGWLSTYLGAADTPYTRLVGRLFLIQLVARAMLPGCKADYMLILEGPQGARKSQTVSILAGSFGGDDMPTLDLGSSRAQEHIIGLWLCEIPEVDKVFHRTAHAMMKAFLTTQRDRIRLPYARRSSEHPRTCTFVGTTNETAGYMKDETGNRRYWPVAIGEINVVELQRDRDQLLAEAIAAYASGEHAWPSSDQDERLILPEQLERLDCDPWIAALRELTTDRHEITTSDCLSLLGVPLERQQRAMQQRVGQCLKQLGWRRFQAQRDGRRQWTYQRR